ncbi:Hypothetical predicted protein [Octopus vulgaris]|uniref:Uncharacterized protein n=1 Tax=Octopus vulgaris TaxID=6645 RepID=A0AA36BMM3_OCTVU|nr:Hypothetical predicted protein [Octopus vulgaris]
MSSFDGDTNDSNKNSSSNTNKCRYCCCDNGSNRNTSRKRDTSNTTTVVDATKPSVVPIQERHEQREDKSNHKDVDISSKKHEETCRSDYG